MNQPLTLRGRFSLKRFLAGEPATGEPVVLSHRRIFILPTGRGLGFALLILLLLTLSFIYNNNLAYILTFLLASIFFVSILHSFRALAGLRLRAGKSSPAFLGEHAGFDIHIDNDSHLPRIGLKVRADGAETVPVDIPPRSKAHLTLRVKTLRRGWMRTGTVTLFSYYPLGLFRAWSPVNLDQQALVYPRPAESSLPFPEMPGSTDRSGAKMPGVDDFQGLREYRAGDSVKQIHWKAFAKGQGVHSKLYSAAQSPEIWLDWTKTPGESIEIRLSRLCRWVLDAELSGAAYGFRIPGTALLPGRGPLHRTQCLTALALF